MCGIAGIVSSNKQIVTLDSLKRMTDSIAHRGPDGEGQWIDDTGRVGLGHRRLSIIDLSVEANQPMHYQDRYTLLFNGEIYNYIELKANLEKEGFHFKTTSDTEVLLALYHKYKTACLPLLDGMFAFAIYDKIEKILFCARDRFGEKPFFYHYEKGKSFHFASEMKALWAVGVDKKVNNKMLFNYLSQGYLDNPLDAAETFFSSCTRLPHAHWLLLNTDTIEITVSRYYDIDYENINHSITEKQAMEKFRELMYTSVKRRLRSDVPVGSSLSGGLDSSLIVCLMNGMIKGTQQVQKTFSAVFPGFAKDESRYINTVVAATNAEAHFVTPDGDTFLADIDKLFYHQEEPIGSASIYVQYCVMRLAKANKVTVLLDGQGADEILAGYHFFYKRYFQELARTNKQLFTAELNAYMQMAGANNLNPNVYNGIKSKMSIHFQKWMPAGKKLFGQVTEMQNPFFNKDFYHAYKRYSFTDITRENTLNQSLYSSVMKKGLQELLRYADRNSMAHSREVRVPFLYHELVDFLFSLPPQFKIHNGWTKWLLRQSFNDVLPGEICWRKDKIGYEGPQLNWMNNPVTMELINESKKALVSKGVLHKRLLNKTLAPHHQNDGNAKTWKIWTAGSFM